MSQRNSQRTRNQEGVDTPNPPKKSLKGELPSNVKMGVQSLYVSCSTWGFEVLDKSWSSQSPQRLVYEHAAASITWQHSGTSKH
eukprot:172971-Amphidinium_carterae.1